MDYTTNYNITTDTNEKLPHVYGEVVFLRVEQSKIKFQKADDINLADDFSSKITFDENFTICLS